MAAKRGTCAECGGSGWRIVEREENSVARRCECWLREDAGRRLVRAGIPPGMRHCTLEEFVVQEERQLRLARAVARDFIDAWPLVQATGILFHGPAGTGKTHLAAAVVSELTQRKGARALFVDFRDLLKTIQESWNPISETSEKEVLRRVLDADLLALDDLGAEKPSAWVRETVAYVINERYNNAKPVLITTNLLLSVPAVVSETARREIARRIGRPEDRSQNHLEERLGAPTMSRLVEMCKIIDLTQVADFRRTHKVMSADKGFRLG